MDRQSPMRLAVALVRLEGHHHLRFFLLSLSYFTILSSTFNCVKSLLINVYDTI